MDKIIDFAEKLFLNPDYTFFGIFILTPVVIVVLWGKVKETGMLKDVSSLISRDRKNKINQLKARIEQNSYLQREKEFFEYELKVYEYQELLKTRENHLPTLIYLNGFEDSRYAIDAYNNSKDFLKFNDSENKLELKKPISPKLAKALAKTGGFIFIFISLSAYALMMFFLYLYNELGIQKDYVGIWAFFNFLLMLLIIFCGMKVLKFFMKRQQALYMLSLTRINVQYSDNIEK
ncbi:hypothetical protein [Acinetobacter sp. 18QD2AZ41W]|uniref:hypothetical protein n=1 Tax=Acinetobacter sp. 18QD2AZ41W TaxID=2692137 RepID=UPI00135C5AEB|nr:hypothetical protein [Acinetobacter sp. 18QD2AZ41W]